METIWQPSPNFTDRRGVARPELIVLHYTAMDSALAAIKRLCDPVAEVSAHYVICNTGRIWRLVAEDKRAWHAGAGSWGGRGDVNSRAIGIELDNNGAQPFCERQMRSLEQLLQTIMARWNISPHQVIGHSDLAPGRKIDPGRRFDWCRLARLGLSVWPSDSAIAQPPPLLTDPAGEFERAAMTFGYDAMGAELLEVFRMRFRPWASGPLEVTDVALARDLAARWPVDRSTGTA